VFEHRSSPLLSRQAFDRRMMNYFLLGLAVVTVTGIIPAPVAHRALHKFHLESGRKNP
jgi:hypothetical protein